MKKSIWVRVQKSKKNLYILVYYIRAILYLCKPWFLEIHNLRKVIFKLNTRLNLYLRITCPEQIRWTLSLSIAWINPALLDAPRTWWSCGSSYILLILLSPSNATTRRTSCHLLHLSTCFVYISYLAAHPDVSEFNNLELEGHFVKYNHF